MRVPTSFHVFFFLLYLNFFWRLCINLDMFVTHPSCMQLMSYVLLLLFVCQVFADFSLLQLSLGTTVTRFCCCYYCCSLLLLMLLFMLLLLLLLLANACNINNAHLNVTFWGWTLRRHTYIHVHTYIAPTWQAINFDLRLKAGNYVWNDLYLCTYVHIIHIVDRHIQIFVCILK